MAEDTKALARRALEEIYEKGDLDLADELIHPAFVDHEPAHPDDAGGPESVKRTASRLHTMFAELRFAIEDEIAEGDRVVQRVTMSGRHEASGRRFAVRHVYLWRIEDGRIAEHWGSRDDLGLLRQVGALPPPG